MADRLFLASQISAIAINHFWSGRWESWNSVPLVAVNCQPHSRHSRTRRTFPVLPKKLTLAKCGTVAGDAVDSVGPTHPNQVLNRFIFRSERFCYIVEIHYISKTRGGMVWSKPMCRRVKRLLKKSEKQIPRRPEGLLVMTNLRDLQRPSAPHIRGFECVGGQSVVRATAFFCKSRALPLIPKPGMSGDTRRLRVAKSQRRKAKSERRKAASHTSSV